MIMECDHIIFLQQLDRVFYDPSFCLFCTHVYTIKHENMIVQEILERARTLHVPTPPLLSDLCMEQLMNLDDTTHPNILKKLFLGLTPDMHQQYMEMLNKNGRMSVRLLRPILRHTVDFLLTSYRRLTCQAQLIDLFQRNCTNALRTLRIENCMRYNVNDRMRYNVNEIIGGSFVNNFFPSLRILSLRASHLSDSGLEAIIGLAPSVQSVNVGMCPHITTEGIKWLARVRRGTLFELYMDRCAKVDAGKCIPELREIVNLEVLHVSMTPRVGDGFVIEVTTGIGRNLKEIALSGCRLTNRSLVYIANECPGLQCLDISNNGDLTDIGLCHLANACRNLKHTRISRNTFGNLALATFIRVYKASLSEVSIVDGTQVITTEFQPLKHRWAQLRYSPLLPPA